MAKLTKVVVIKPSREKSIRLRHPWVFSGAIESIAADIDDGEIAAVRSSQGEPLGTAYVNRRSQITARMLSFDPAERIGPAFWSSRIERAVRRRGDRPCCRLVNAESDGLPGLTLDRYGDVVVMQISTLGMDRVREDICRVVRDVVQPATLYERSDMDDRKKEGLEPRAGLLAGVEPAEALEICEESANGRTVRLLVDVRHGHKTGAYLDQRENRRHVAERCSGARVLNLFAFTGAFSVHAVAGGASSVVNVDSSSDALKRSERIAARNGMSDRIEHSRDNVFELLRKLHAQEQRFDVVIVDPPKLVRSASKVTRGTRAYKDVNRLALSLLRPGGYLATFSCSGLVSAELFQKVVFSAAIESGRDAQIIERFTQADDHPVLLSFPEGDYLKGLGCSVW